jgi:hypothetical protein
MTLSSRVPTLVREVNLILLLYNTLTLRQYGINNTRAEELEILFRLFELCSELFVEY